MRHHPANSASAAGLTVCLIEGVLDLDQAIIVFPCRLHSRVVARFVPAASEQGVGNLLARVHGSPPRR